MAETKTSTLLSDVSIEGDIVEKDKIVIDAKFIGDIKSDEVETDSNSNIKGNIKSLFLYQAYNYYIWSGTNWGCHSANCCCIGNS